MAAQTGGKISGQRSSGGCTALAYADGRGQYPRMPGVDEARAAEIAADSLHRFGRMVVEVMRFPLLNKDNIDKKVKVEGLEYLEAAYAQARASLWLQVTTATGSFWALP